VRCSAINADRPYKPKQDIKIPSGKKVKNITHLLFAFIKLGKVLIKKIEFKGISRVKLPAYRC
jgi:hypothetical protein